MFQEEDLNITFEEKTLDCQKTDYLDVELDLAKHEHYPWRKPNNTILYINTNSNHPKNIIKQIKPNCEMRLSMLSSSEEVFKKVKGPYEDALKSSGHLGHDDVLKYIQPETTNKKQRKRKVMYCNLPYSKHVKTKVGAKFLKLVKDTFEKPSLPGVTPQREGHPLSKIFNRTTIKFSPCTLTNMKQHHSKINSKLVRNNDQEQVKECNCSRKYKNNCPVQGRCQEKSVVYKAVVKSENESKIYYGSTKNEFKTRFLQHMSSFNTNLTKSSTTLAKYVQDLSKRKIKYKISWSIKAKAHTFSSGSKKCDLCITEKLTILKADQKTLINKRDELLSKCPHKRAFYLSSIKV